MTGCKGYDLWGSDARTEIERTKEAKRRMLGLARKMEMEMDEYRRLKRSLRVLKSYTDYEEDLYDEAV